jgi:hypothetical protein
MILTSAFCLSYLFVHACHLTRAPAKFHSGIWWGNFGFSARSGHVKVNPPLFRCLVPEEWAVEFAKVGALLSSVSPSKPDLIVTDGKATRWMKYRKSKPPQHHSHCGRQLTRACRLWLLCRRTTSQLDDSITPFDSHSLLLQLSDASPQETRQILVPMTDSNELQPSQINLEDIKEIDKALQRLGTMLQRAKFEPHKEGTEICTDPGMPAIAKELLDALGFKVPSLNWPVLLSS